MRWLSILTILVLLVLSVGGLPAAKADDPMATSEPTQPPAGDGSPLPLTGVVTPVHDPTLIKAGDMYYVFGTGPSIPIHCSKDMLKWDNCGQVFRIMPIWAYKSIQGVGDLWAPDIVFWDGKYHLYYAASTFGSNISGIGLATNVTLDQGSKDYKWSDDGAVILSQKTDNFNAIDPNLVTDQDGGRWLVFGSFWSGIKMRKIDSATGKLAADDTTLYDLASRPGFTAIEGAYVTYRSGYYYLFASFDFCCRGVNSTYNIRVGRADKITGPYADNDSKAMLDGGGTLILDGSDRWKGPGHNSIYIEGDTYYMVYHAYDAQMNGAPDLRIQPLQWDQDGWPFVVKANN